MDQRQIGEGGAEERVCWNIVDNIVDSDIFSYLLIAKCWETWREWEDQRTGIWWCLSTV